MFIFQFGKIQISDDRFKWEIQQPKMFKYFYLFALWMTLSTMTPIQQNKAKQSFPALKFKIENNQTEWIERLFQNYAIICHFKFGFASHFFIRFQCGQFTSNSFASMICVVQHSNNIIFKLNTTVFHHVVQCETYYLNISIFGQWNEIVLTVLLMKWVDHWHCRQNKWKTIDRNISIHKICQLLIEETAFHLPR